MTRQPVVSIFSLLFATPTLIYILYLSVPRLTGEEVSAKAKQMSNEVKYSVMCTVSYLSRLCVQAHANQVPLGNSA